MSAPGGVLALDLSTRTGWAYGRPGAPPVHGVLALPQGGGAGGLGAVMAALADGLRDLLTLHQPAWIVMEAPLPPGAQTHAHTARLQLYLAGVVELMGYRWEVQVREAASQSVRAKLRIRKAEGDKGWKPAVLRWCAAEGHSVTDHNAADAIALLTYSFTVLPVSEAA